MKIRLLLYSVLVLALGCSESAPSTVRGKAIQDPPRRSSAKALETPTAQPKKLEITAPAIAKDRLAADAPAAATPEDAVRQMETAMRSGSYEAELEVLTTNQREIGAKIKAALLAGEQASVQLNKACETRFGKPMFSPTDKLDFNKMNPDPGLRLEVVGKQARGEKEAELKVRVFSLPSPGEAREMREVMYGAVKEASGWKLRIDDANAFPGLDALAFFERSARAYRKVTGEIEAGVHKNFADAQKAWLAALEPD